MTSPLMACCGGEGPYHFNFSVGCGDSTSTWCSDPWSYVCWDGKHLTEAAYHVIAHGILDGSCQLQSRPAVDLIPIVDSSITDQLMLTDLQALVRAGAKTVLVSGIFPMGCIALFLTKFETQNAAPNDPETGCLKWLNEFSQQHNLLLRRELRRLRRAHPHSTIIYDDIYRALLAIYMSPSQFGEPQTAAASRDYEFISSWLSE
ncbi:GDSL esterase/lipase At2g27360-like [Musa acuminata AAA Group]|uniref:GDSL esterase/lipase At2g27360-like n=1 Tax=Musa acuminata AAA Group TaxID=214697 RepID=UPI0031E14CC6